MTGITGDDVSHRMPEEVPDRVVDRFATHVAASG